MYFNTFKLFDLNVSLGRLKCRFIQITSSIIYTVSNVIPHPNTLSGSNCGINKIIFDYISYTKLSHILKGDSSFDFISRKNLQNGFQMVHKSMFLRDSKLTAFLYIAMVSFDNFLF